MHLFRPLGVAVIHDIADSLPAQLAAVQAGIRLIRARDIIRGVDQLLDVAFPRS